MIFCAKLQRIFEYHKYFRNFLQKNAFSIPLFACRQTSAIIAKIPFTLLPQRAAEEVVFAVIADDNNLTIAQLLAG